MLPGEISLPEAIFALNGQAVNRLFDALCQDSDRWLKSQFAELFRALQIQWFSSHSLGCPRCGNQHVIRKGWRSRLLKSSRGQLSFVVLQARCKACSRTFRPFTSQSGLPTSRRFLDELLTKATDLAVQLPFARSSRILKALTGGSISHEGIRQKVAQEADQIALPSQGVEQTVLVDATKVKAGTKQRGAPVHLAISVEPGPTVAGRKTITKRLCIFMWATSGHCVNASRIFGRNIWCMTEAKVTRTVPRTSSGAAGTWFINSSTISGRMVSPSKSVASTRIVFSRSSGMMKAVGNAWTCSSRT